MGSNLPLLAAALIAEGLVEMDALLGHLAPGDDEIRKVRACLGRQSRTPGEAFP